MQHQKAIQIAAKYGEHLTEFSFTSASQKVTCYLQDGKPFFPAVEVCKLLGLNQTTKALYALDEDEKLTLPVVRAGQTRNVNLVTESGLYHLIFISRKPSAKEFRRHVTNVILPEIRKTGSYTVLPKEQQFLKGVTTQKVNGQKMYAYKQVRERAGYSTRGSSANHKNRYPNHFVLMGTVLYVTQEFANHLYHQRQVFNNRAVLKAMQPVLPFNFGESLAPTISKEEVVKKGGSHA